MENQQIVAVFQTWSNGGTQTSNMVIASRDGQEAVNDFIEQHNNSGTFATLRTFTSEEEAWDAREAIRREEEEWEAIRQEERDAWEEEKRRQEEEWEANSIEEEEEDGHDICGRVKGIRKRKVS